MYKTGIFSGVIFLSVALSSQAQTSFYSQPEPIQKAINDNSALVFNAIGVSPFQINDVAYDDRTQEYFFKRHDQRAAQLFEAGLIDEDGLVNALSHRYPDKFAQYKKEKNPLRAKMLLRDTLTPLAKEIASSSLKVAFEEEYLFFDLITARADIQVSYEPLGLKMNTLEMLRKNCGESDGELRFSPDRYDVGGLWENSLNIELAFKNPENCAVFLTIPDEETGIKIIDDMQSNNILRRAVFRLNSQRDGTEKDNFKTVINAELIGFAIVSIDKNNKKSLIAFTTVDSDGPASVEHKTHEKGNETDRKSYTANKPLNISCKIEDYKARGFLITTGFKAKQYIGNVDKEVVLDRISTNETANNDYDIKVASRTPNMLVLHQKASTGNVVSTYVVDNGYLSIDFDLPTGVSFTGSQAKDGFCEIINKL
ncbi:hypothetical protein [Arsukibacterium sp.]|uniref:hypothetical protein n=1 Tax=Arsukibacterium sp. TaxID=1977258 RepID=UPI001BD4975D|nr:hypothetical protein [Arsukibacterium sp.]